MEDEDGAMTPFWLQTTNTLRQADRPRHRRRSTSDFFLNSTVFIILLVVCAIFFIFFIIPSLLSFTSQIFKPNLVKKSWDSLNLVLVLFAIVCGFLSRTNNDNSGSHEDHYVSNSSHDVQRSNPSTPRQWYEYSDRTAYNSMSRLRSSSSYPDLRQESPWVTSDDHWRFSDDTQVNNYRFSDSDDLHRRRRRREVEINDSDAKNIAVDTFVSRPKEVSYTPPHRSPPPPSPPPPPPQTPAPAPPPPPTTVKRKAKRTSQALAHKEKSEKKDVELKKLEPPPTPTPTPPPPPPPPPAVSQQSEEKNDKGDRKRGGATKDFLTSLYHTSKKKKKQRRKSIDNFDSILQPPPSPSSLHLQPQPSPPPPPPPPPPSVLHNLFSSKKGKTKKIHSVPPTPPPPPPPPPVSSTARVSKTKTQIALAQSHGNPVAARKPPLPVKTSSFNSVEENTNSGSESPLNRIPPPPPLPPFKMPEWKFVVQGDYVRIKSNNSSRSGSPDLDDVGPSSSQSTSTMAAMDGGDSTPPPPMFCPSPDVDTKADNFIARFRAGLKLEKMNSIRKQGMGMSNLGPERSPSPETTAGPGPSQI